MRISENDNTKSPENSFCDMLDKLCDMPNLIDNMRIVTVAHTLFAGKTACEINEICYAMQVLIMLSKTYYK